MGDPFDANDQFNDSTGGIPYPDFETALDALSLPSQLDYVYQNTANEVSVFTLP